VAGHVRSLSRIDHVSQARFVLLLGIVAVLVAGGSFVAATAVLDDGKADPPPSPDGGDTSDPEVPASSTTTTAPVATGELASPTWIVVITSEGDEAAATASAQRAADAGYPTGVLRSDDYPSLRPGFWVAYAGPYSDQAAAEAGSAELAADGFANTYRRCVGEQSDCGVEADG
jgi:hypothetical protein